MEKNGGNDNVNDKTLKTLVKLLVVTLTMLKHIANNYRPISLISNISKVLEKIIHRRLITFINKCDILAKNQYGFRKIKVQKMR